MRLRRRKKSTPARAADLASKTAKGVVAYKGTKGVAKRLPWVAGAVAGIAAVIVGAKALRGGGEPAATT
jgi:hypothetical protein